MVEFVSTFPRWDNGSEATGGNTTLRGRGAVEDLYCMPPAILPIETESRAGWVRVTSFKCVSNIRVVVMMWSRVGHKKMCVLCTCL